MYSLERRLHQFHLLHKRPSGLGALMVNYVITQVATGMVGMFGVLFVYELGRDMMEGLVMVAGFFGLQRVVVGVMVPVMGKVIDRLGYRRTMIGGLIALAAKSWLLMQVSASHLGLLVPALILGGIAIAGYYLGYHGIFLDDNDDRKVGEQMGLITMAGRMGLMVSPLLAGWLIDNYGFPMMFGVSMSLLLVSVGPLLMMPHHRHDGKFSWRRVRRLIKETPAMTKAVGWWAVENAIQAFFWPVFLFLLLKSHIRFGELGSAVMIINSLAVYMAGKIYDKKKWRLGYRLGAVMVGLSYIWRFWSPTAVWAMTADGFNRMVSPFWWMKIRRKALLVGEKADSLVFAAAWELIVTGGFIGGMVVGLGLLWFSGGEWKWLAAPAIAGVWMSTRKVKKR